MVAAMSSSVASRPERRDRLGDDFRRQRTDGVHAQNFAVLCLGHHLDEAFVLAEDGGFAVGEKRKLPGLHLEAGFARLLFGQADRADLRLAVGGVRAALAVKRLHLFARHAAHGDDSLHRSGVRELRKAGDDVADGVEPRLVGFEIGIRVDEAALELSPWFSRGRYFR